MKYYSPRCWVHHSDHRDGKAERLSSQGYISPTLECPRIWFGLLSSHIVDEGKQLEMEDESQLQDSLGFLGVAPLIPSTVPLHFLHARSLPTAFLIQSNSVYTYTTHDSPGSRDAGAILRYTYPLIIYPLAILHCLLSTHTHTHT